MIPLNQESWWWWRVPSVWIHLTLWRMREHAVTIILIQNCVVSGPNGVDSGTQSSQAGWRVKSSPVKWLSNVQSPLTPPTITIGPLLLTTNSMLSLHLYGAFTMCASLIFSKGNPHQRGQKADLRSGREQDLKWNLLCFTYGPLPLSLSPVHQKPPMFYSGPGLGEGSGWVCWPAVLVGTKVSEKTLLGLPMIGSDNQIMKQDW